MARYTVGLRVPSATDPTLHVTLCYLGEADEKKLVEVYAELYQFQASLPIKGLYLGYAMFGPKEDVPVRLVAVEGEVREKLQALYTKFGVPEPGMSFHPVKPNYHVNMKKVEAEIRAAEFFIGHEIFVKQLGPHDPCFCIETLKMLSEKLLAKQDPRNTRS